MDESSLLALYNARDEKAISETNAYCGALCRGLLSNILKDKRDVEECLNSVYMKLWQSIPPAEPKSFKAYAAKAARNEALMKVRHDKRRLKEEAMPEAELASFLPPVESEAEAKELTEAINRFLKAQPEEKRKLFIRRYWYFDSLKDAADKLGMSQSKAASMLFRLRNELRAYLEREELL